MYVKHLARTHHRVRAQYSLVMVMVIMMEMMEAVGEDAK